MQKPLAPKVYLSTRRMRLGSNCAQHLKFRVRFSSESKSTTGTTIRCSKTCVSIVSLDPARQGSLQLETNKTAVGDYDDRNVSEIVKQSKTGMAATGVHKVR
jgi:hypothetical protein